MTQWWNLLEPAALLEAFETCLPEGFEAVSFASRVPAFTTPFDVATTAGAPLQRVLHATPLLHRLLRIRTCFVGTTVTEFAVLPHAPEVRTSSEIVAQCARWPLTIIKDLPVEPLLVGEAAFEATQALARQCVAEGFVPVQGQALAFVPLDFTSIDDFLARFSHARRKNIRRKLRSRRLIEIEELPIGDVRFDDRLLERIYALYLNVYRQSEIHFDLLRRTFFEFVLRSTAIAGTVTLYRMHGRVIGFNLCVIESGVMIDKYIGFEYPVARDSNLYAVSWFHNLERCIELGLRCYVAGWTDPEVKRSLGANFTMTRHLVYARNPLLRLVLRACRRLFEADADWARHRATAHS